MDPYRPDPLLPCIQISVFDRPLNMPPLTASCLWKFGTMNTSTPMPLSSFQSSTMDSRLSIQHSCTSNNTTKCIYLYITLTLTRHQVIVWLDTYQPTFAYPWLYGKMDELHPSWFPLVTFATPPPFLVLWQVSTLRPVSNEITVIAKRFSYPVTWQPLSMLNSR